MSYKLSTYAEFHNPESAAQAVRALRAAGFDNIVTEDLAHPLNSSSDAADPTSKKSLRNSLLGLALGAILGVGWGLLVFGVPVYVLNVQFGTPFVIIGTALCVAVGAVIGFEQAFVIFERWTLDPTSILDGKPVGVRVFGNDGGAQLVRAREILSMYAEETSPRERRWWQLRRWAH